MVKCKFCGLGDVIKKSHIIPEFMYENTYDDKLRMIAFESDLTQVRLRQKGYYEPILCRNCENFFNVNFEKPCVGLFRALPTQVAQNNFVKLNAAPCLDLLVLSIIWRASLAAGNGWKGLILGPHQDKIKQCLQHKLVNNDYKFWLYLVKSKDDSVVKGLVTSVQCLKVKTHNLYHFAAGGLQFVVKVSSHALNGVFPAPMSFDQEFYASVIDMSDLPSLQEMFLRKRLT